MNPCITVFGSSRPRPGNDAYRVAFDLGRAVALHGWTLCNGGYGGTMEAAARGALAGGGHTVGVLCAVFRRRKANPYLRETVRTRTLFERLDALVRLADAFVVLPGGTGTLLELAAVLELRRAGRLPRRPLLLLGRHWEPVVRAVRNEGRASGAARFVDSVEACVALLRRRWNRGSAG